MMRKTDTARSTLPNFDRFKPSLNSALQLLKSQNKTFRVEKMPLCYIPWFEYCSTETRKLVKDEERIVHFLDFRETVHETQWEHEKLDKCKSCDLNNICSWIYEHKKYYNFVDVYPQKLSKDEKIKLIQKIKR